ncbi:MAG: hypothetical protein GEU76_07345 [Alphaproteobacteria bacterium]|nr:hypothetical protein [Alphaproteobacteria bacterium]
MIDMNGKDSPDPATGMGRSSGPDSGPESGPESGMRPPEKPRGFLSFLTWPFLLAQLAALDHALGGLIRPAAAVESADTDQAPASAGDAGSGELSDREYPAMQMTAAEEPRPESRDSEGADPTDAGFGGDSHVGVPETPIADDHVLSGVGLTGAIVVNGGSSGGGGGPLGAHMTPNAQIPAAGASDGSGTWSIPDVWDSMGWSQPDGIGGLSDFGEVLPGVGTTVGNVTGIAGEVLQTAEPVVDSVLPTLAAATNAVTGVVGGALEATEVVVESVPATLDAATDAVTGVVGGTLKVTEPVLDSALSTLNAITDAATGGGGFLGSGGSLAFEAQPSPASGTDDLFSGGRYTDYGLAMRTDGTDTAAGGVDPDRDPVDAEGSAPQDGDRGGAEASGDDATDQGEHDSNDLLHAAPAPVFAELASALDDAALRGGDSLL